MSITLLVLMGIAVLACGVGMTFVLASVIPQAVLQHAQEHGRYAGLTGSDPGGNAAEQAAAGARNLRPQNV
jgi:hypothetical protein